MSLLSTTFRAVSLIFGISAVGTGIQALVAPIAFSKSFGLRITPSSRMPPGSQSVQSGAGERDQYVVSTNRKLLSYEEDRSAAISYVSLMGVRQLGTGIIILVFAYQGKWIEIATILTIIGFLVAGTDGIYLAQTSFKKGLFHAVPGAIIAGLAAAVILS